MNRLLFLCLGAIFLLRCSVEESSSLDFELMAPESTGIHFANMITEDDSVNLFDYYYIYNGAGVAVGDFDNDGLPDLFFGGNMVSSKLYLNKGSFTFKDITKEAGLISNAWIMGVSLVDINADGLLDIYASVAGPRRAGYSMENLLFVHQGLDDKGIPHFVESANEYGILDSSFSVHSAFLDYDLDGDLDLFILNNLVDEIDKAYIHESGKSLTDGKTIDRLYENMGWVDSLNHPVYVYKKQGSGIIHEGYGLGLAVDDINNDTWPDIYVANDFLPNDRLYINQRDGSFKDRSQDFLQHQTFNGMGVDIADVNNDLLPDIMVLDMLPNNNDRRKSMIGGMENQGFLLRKKAGYQAQYIRNTLQLNQGKDEKGKVYFSDISQLAGVHASDWSWAPLLADFDNDGDRDIFISNGYVKDMTDLDYIKYTSSSSYFGTKEAKVDRQKGLMDALTEVKIPNFLFENTGDFRFKDVSKSAGVDIPSFSNGAMYADLDGDGDLDIISNDINAKALVYKNTRPGNHNYLKIRLKGKGLNIHGIGAKIYIEHGSQQFYTYVSPTKGYLSSIQGDIHVGLGKDTLVNSVRIIWPDGNEQIKTKISANQTVEINYAEGANIREENVAETQPLFSQIEGLIKHTSPENIYNDFLHEPLLLRKYSMQGPTLSVGNLDQENGTDVFVGGSHGNSPALFMQDKEGGFVEKDFPMGEEVFEDVASFLFDADNDEDLDLYVVSGGSEFPASSPNYQDRLYRNDGEGDFSRSHTLPAITASGGCVVGADYDKDGDIDLFVGGRYSPGTYPSPPQSYLLENDKGQFSDVSLEIEGLSEIGMISSAIWSDYDQDGWEDLLLVGEWTPLTIFRNDKGHLKKIEIPSLSQSNGWWNVIKGADFDQDGDIDYVVGNLGLNQDYAASLEKPFYLFADDFDENGKIDPIFACYMKSKVGSEYELYPFHSRDDLSKQIVAFKRIFSTYQEYSEATLDQVISKDMQEKAMNFQAHTFASTLFINLGNGQFEMQQLPLAAQLGPIHDLIIEDINQDGNVDIVAAGNDYASETTYGWHDASLGICLLGDGKNHFRALAPNESGLFLNQEVKSIKSFVSNSGLNIILMGVSSGKLVALRRN